MPAEPAWAGFFLSLRDREASVRTQGRLVSSHAEGGLRLLLMGRLYYRDELRRRLGTVAEDDAALALAAYRRFGRDGLTALEGDFALTLFDRGEARVLALRDISGGFPLYWTQRPQGPALATGLRPLVELDWHLDRDYLAETLMLPYAEIDYHAGTPFRGIQRVVPGTLLDVELSRGQTTITRFWDWRERLVDPGAGSPQEWAEGYRERLARAVTERLRGRVVAQLSGGMDSTSVALLARDALTARGERLATLSLVYERLPSLIEERPTLEAALAEPGLDPLRIPADDLLDYDGFDSLPPHDEPFTGLFRAGLDRVTTEAAAGLGADTVLTGLGADEVLDDPPFHLADLLRRGRPRAAWREAVRWAEAQRCSPWQVLRPFGLAPLLPAQWRTGPAPWEKQTAWTTAPWVLPAFAGETQLRQRAAEQLRLGARGADTVLLSELLNRVRLTSGDWLRATLGAPRGLLLTHPFRDPRVLAFGLGARRRLPPQPGRRKALLAEALRDTLPEAIVRRRGKSHFNAVYYLGLARNLPALEALVRESRVEELGLFDRAILTACLRRAATGVGQVNSMLGLNNSLAIVQWLALLPRWLSQDCFSAGQTPP